MRHVRLAFRTLFRTPFVTAVAVLSLALGIGANAAIFSLTDQVLLRPLPVPEPERLVNLTAPGPNPGSQSCNQAGGCDEVFSYPMFRDLERSQNVLTGLAAHRTFGANFAVKGEPFTGEATEVSGSYFRTLALTPALGRLLGPDDDATIGANFVAVLSYAFWQGRLGADRSVVGKTITVNGQTVDHRRRGPARLRRHHVRQPPAGVRPAHDGPEALELGPRTRTGAATGSTCSGGSSPASRSPRRRAPSTGSTARS